MDTKRATVAAEAARTRISARILSGRVLCGMTFICNLSIHDMCLAFHEESVVDSLGTSMCDLKIECNEFILRMGEYIMNVELFDERENVIIIWNQECDKVRIIQVELQTISSKICKIS